MNEFRDEPTDPGLVPSSDPPPPRRRRGRLLAWLAAGAALGALLLFTPLGLPSAGEWLGHLFGRSGPPPASTGGRKVLFYRNPMDPTVTSPVAMKDSMGMDYVPVYADEAEKAPPAGSPSKPAGERKILFYRNPMDPTITSPVPMQDEMGMDYVPVYADEAGKALGRVGGRPGGDDRPGDGAEHERDRPRR